METEAKSIEGFIEEYDLRGIIRPAPSNPNMDDMPAGSSHWRVTIYRAQGASVSVYYSMGPGLSGEPTLAEVLQCLADDASSADNSSSFDEWAEEMGYFPMDSSEDYRKAQRTWDTIHIQRKGLENVLGKNALEELLWEVERS